MTQNTSYEKIPLLMRTYGIGNELKIKFILIAGKLGSKDQILIELLAEPNTVLLTFPIIDTDLFLSAVHEFEIDWLSLIMDGTKNPLQAIN